MYNNNKSSASYFVLTISLKHRSIKSLCHIMDHQWLTQRIGVAWNQNRIIFNVVRSHDVTANTDIRVADTRVAADPRGILFKEHHADSWRTNAATSLNPLSRKSLCRFMACTRFCLNVRVECFASKLAKSINSYRFDSHRVFLNSLTRFIFKNNFRNF